MSMSEVQIFNSVITGLHAAKIGSHPAIKLDVLIDDTREDPDCMKVVCVEVPAAVARVVTWLQSSSIILNHKGLLLVQRGVWKTYQRSEGSRSDVPPPLILYCVAQTYP